MKYILLFLFTLLLHQSLYANIDERKIDVYFANGIGTEKKDSEKNALKDC